MDQPSTLMGTSLGDTMAKEWYTSKTLWANVIGIIAIVAQKQYGFLIDPATQVAMLAVMNMILRAVTSEIITWREPDE